MDICWARKCFFPVDIYLWGDILLFTYKKLPEIEMDLKKTKNTGILFCYTFLKRWRQGQNVSRQWWSVCVLCVCFLCKSLILLHIICAKSLLGIIQSIWSIQLGIKCNKLRLFELKNAKTFIALLKHFVPINENAQIIIEFTFYYF
jgi:hypothetical protein